MKILLIAGHGAGDSGACSTVGGVKYQEATLTRSVAAALQEKLEPYMTVGLYDTSRNAYTDYQAGTLKSRAAFSAYDYVLEIHFNAYKATEADEKTKGVEAFVTTSETGITVEEAICKNIAALGFTNRGVKRKNWAVISTAKNQGVSSCLLEVCFIDDPDDMAIYNARFNDVVDAIAQGVVEGFGAGTYLKVGWQKNDKGWWYQNADGTWPKDGWFEIGGRQWYFDQNGYLLTNTTLEEDGKVYTFDDDGIWTVQEAETVATFDFDDVSKTAWYAEAVQYCADKGLMQGTGAGKFEPFGTVTRAELATVLMRLHKALTEN